MHKLISKPAETRPLWGICLKYWVCNGRIWNPSLRKVCPVNLRSINNYALRITHYALRIDPKGFCKIVDLFVNERIYERTLRGVFFGENFTLNADRVEQ